MRIGDLANATGVTRRLLRYYEEQGMLRPLRAANGCPGMITGLRRQRARLTEAITRLQTSQRALDSMLATALRQPARVSDDPTHSQRRRP